MVARRVPTSLQFFKRLKWLDGTPLVIEEYRQRIFRDVLDQRDVRGHPQINQALCGRAKKNWKSADLVLAALFRLFAWQSYGGKGNQTYIIASDEGQAKDDLEIATKLVRANPALREAARILKDGIDRKDGQGFLRVLPGKDAAGAHGKTYCFLGIDELHTATNWDMLEALARDPHRPDSLVWITSYASFNHKPGIPLYDLFQKGKAGGDHRFFFSWYSASYCTDPAFADADPERKANPSMDSWEDPGYLDEERKRLPVVRFRRLHLNLEGYPTGGAFDASKLDAAVERGIRSRPPQPGQFYVAFLDMSGGSSDACALALGHVEGGRRVVDLLMDQAVKPPFNPKEAIPRFVAFLREYRVSRVMADTYGTKAPTLDFTREFRDRGIQYVPSPLTKPELFEAFEVPLNAGEIILLDDAETLEQLAGLQRRGLKIEKRSGEHDDKANALVGVCWLLGQGLGPPLAIKDAVKLSGTRASVAGPMGLRITATRRMPTSIFDRVDAGMVEGAAGASTVRRSWWDE